MSSGMESSTRDYIKREEERGEEGGRKGGREQEREQCGQWR